MTILTERGLIRSVADRWARQYSGAFWAHDKDKQAKTAKLRALDPNTATADDVAAVIGNRSWTSLVCHECRAEATEAVQLGEEPDYESATATICVPCLRAAVALLPG